MASSRHVWTGSRRLSSSRVSLTQSVKKISGSAQDGPWEKSTPRKRLALFGGKDGFVVALLCSQTCNLAGDHRVGGGDVVRLGTGSNEGISCARNQADPIRCGSGRLFQRAVILVGE